MAGWLNTRANEYDVFIHLTHSVEGRHVVFETLTSFWWPDDYRRKVCAGNYLETAHEIAGVPFEFGPLYYATDEEKNPRWKPRNSMGDKKCVTWVLSGTRNDKVYPYCSFVVSRLMKELGAHVVLMGAGAKEFKMAEAIQEHVKLSDSAVLKGLHLALSAGTSDLVAYIIGRSVARLASRSRVRCGDNARYRTGWACAMEPVPKIVLVVAPAPRT